MKLTSIHSHTIRTSTLCALLSLGAVTQTAYAQEEPSRWSVGAGIMVEQSPYRDYDSQVIGMPLVGYEGDRVFLRGPRAGVHLINTQANNLYMHISYAPWQFKRSKTDDQALKQLSTRHSTAMAGIGYQYNSEWGNIQAELAADVLGRSNGIIADLSYRYSLQLDNWRFEPGVGVQWQSDKHNDYYYGINNREASRSGLKQYSPGSGFSPYLALSVNYAFNKNWQAFAMGRYTRISNAAKDSPMVNRSHSSILGIGIIYTFN